MELWKPIAGYEGYYEVSTLGRVKLLCRAIQHTDGRRKRVEKERVLIPFILKSGQSRVLLRKTTKGEYYKIHDLVLETFSDKIPEGMKPHHIDGNKKNNNLTNLKWVPINPNKITYKDGEIWKSIPEYHGYEASNLGRIRSLDRYKTRSDGITRLLKGKILSPWMSHYHLYVTIYQNKNSRKKEQVHRLVLLAFVGPCPEGMEGCHFPDRDGTNNKIENLCWGTKQENQGPHKVLHGTSNRGERCGTSKLTNKLVLEIRATGATTRKQFINLAKLYKISSTTIYSIIKRRSWKDI